MSQRLLGRLAAVVLSAVVLASCGLALDDEVGVPNTTLPPPLPIAPGPGGSGATPASGSSAPTATDPRSGAPVTDPDGDPGSPTTTTTTRPLPGGWCTTLHNVLVAPATGGRVEQMRDRAQGFERAMSEIVEQATPDLRSLAQAILATIRTASAGLGADSTADQWQLAVDEVVRTRTTELTSLLDLAASRCGEDGSVGDVDLGS